MRTFSTVFCWVVVVALLPVSCCAGDKPASEFPNVILILADDLGWGDLGCYGATEIATPNCDRLAREGIRFTDAHSASAVCSPSRYAVLTGRYGWRSWLKNGILLEHMPLMIEPGRLTLPAMLKERGYATTCIGKWHLGWGDRVNPNWNGDVKPGPLETGFEYFFGLPFGHAASYTLNVYVENRRIVGIEPGGPDSFNQMIRLAQRHLAETATRLSEAAVRFIENNKDRPFFLYYPTANVHEPYTAAPRFKKTSRAGPYGDFVVEFDWAVGEIMNTLDRLGLADRTLVILTSDNGANERGSMNRHDPNATLRGRKGEIYEGGHRVPFIARWPGHTPPGPAAVSEETICLTDIMATCAAIVGYELPESAAEDSYDLGPALFGRSYPKPIREATVHHSMTGLFAIRQGGWKFIEGPGPGVLRDPQVWPGVRMESRSKPVRNPDTGEWEDLWFDFKIPPPKPEAPPFQLYDLHEDPAETLNVWNKRPEVVERLQGLLDRYREEGRSGR